ncbi:MAG: hypothetical protein GY865_04455, partial [candidate division Zixibacteria bacterium]|nr:hypothetical protein [candidate division Zixibacteria bacterium]
MGFLSKLNRLIELYLIAVKTFMRGGVWIPFIIYGVLQYAILIVLTNYTNPFIYPILLPVVNLFLDENAVMFEHYPTIYLMLPYLFQWFKIALGLIFEGLAVGLTVVLAIKILNIRGFGVLKLSFARNRWLYLALAWTLITALLWALNRYLPVLFTDLLDSSPRRQMAFDFAMRLLTVGFYSIFI